MTWVVKSKAGLYDAKPGHSNTGETMDQHSARRFDTYAEAAARIAYLDHAYVNHHEPRIVRLKPRAKLDEAAIRADERCRVAAAIAHEIKLPFAFQPGSTLSPLDVPELRERIIAHDWPAKKP